MHTLRMVPMAMLLATFAGAARAQETPYLAGVRAQADALLEHAVDRHGPRNTGMILSVLDRRTLAPPAELPPPPDGVRGTDRAGRYGSNANLQLNLYETLFALSRVTGEERYARARRLCPLRPRRR